jgi:tetratricopeptide (TPR) repeat protein
MEQLKEKADTLHNNKEYNEAIEYYTLALDYESDEKYKIYMNRCLSYYKLEKFNEALMDAVKATRMKSDYSKAWGRLGSCLLALNKKDQAIFAFKKAYDLEPTNENYKKESEKDLSNHESDTEDEESDIPSLTKKLENMNLKTIPNFVPNLNNNNLKNLLNNNMVDNMLNNMLSNQELMNKMSDDNFQKKILSYQNNPFEAFKDKEMMSLMGSLLNDITKSDNNVEKKD